MKLVLFNDYRLGVLKGNDVVDVTSVVQKIPHSSPGDLMNQLIARFEEFRAPLQRAADSGKGVPVAQVKLRPPLPKPVNIDCMAVNYMEDGTRKAPAPINAFLKSPGCVVGHGDTMVLPDVAATIFEGEAELVTKDEIKDPHKLQVKLTVNGVVKQNFNTDDMAHKIPRCIEWITSIHDLEPGDILATGTNHRGLSAFQDGDTVELEVEGLGKLTVKIKDEFKRTWARETRSEREAKGLQGTTPQLTGKYAPARTATGPT